MDRRKSFKGYGKVEETEEAIFQKKLKKRSIIIFISIIILLAVVITAAVAGVILSRQSTDDDGDKAPAPPPSPSQSLKAVCSVTQYPDTCFTSLSPLVSNSTTFSSIIPSSLFNLSLQVAKHSVSELRLILPKHLNDTVLAKALKDCGELFDDAEDQLRESSELTVSSKKGDDLRTWLSAVLTDLDSCVEGVSEINGTTSLVQDLQFKMKNATELVSNSLAIVSKVGSILGKFKDISNSKVPFHLRKLLRSDGNNQMFPEWVGSVERRLLLGEGEEEGGADAVVAKDGSGQYKTITEAIKAVPLKSVKRYVIYVKEGVYEENVVLSKHVWNVMMYGDGMDKSVVSGHLNFIDGTPTFSTATFAIAGKGFIAKDMAFKNTAGAEKHQAVALRSQSDQSIFYRCLFDGFQDTLYTHSYRQFYRECTITGTIDFIFGNAAVVFQNCKIQPRQPMAKQFNTITAQGKKDVNQNTGISIQKCTISGLGQVTAPTYLGRPWQQYSTTLVMQSVIGPVLNPLGWIGWVNGVGPPSTIYYAEYQNTGPGADLSKRVKWAGFKPDITADEASKFTVGNFIDGSSWLTSTDVAFQTTL
ncbi:LOW QUALITY PROTEIN: pectinesterase 3-like [Chenopodium quinoa]|uniref:pectinesterase 3-like n=1 Tax=Chenopodium quinoa TaxID=63459 RepID=UPI000B77C0C5|nr:pectinesterase 3-like [Chenopodium quinoa]XP_021761867.1 LOW QUALITY PROTEIN: pectinesterase 3-like [Chenopodium quinoa]